MLNYARSLGDHLTVAIDSDQRVRSLKGSLRPVNDQQERKLLLENLRSVDAVVVFDTDQELIDLIKQADIMVKGSDYKGQYIIGSEVCPEIVFFEKLPEYSTTMKIQYILSLK